MAINKTFVATATGLALIGAGVLGFGLYQLKLDRETEELTRKCRYNLEDFRRYVKGIAPNPGDDVPDFLAYCEYKGILTKEEKAEALK